MSTVPEQTIKDIKEVQGNVRGELFSRNLLRERSLNPPLVLCSLCARPAGYYHRSRSRDSSWSRSWSP